jgi:hypothetical protein
MDDIWLLLPASFLFIRRKPYKWSVLAGSKETIFVGQASYSVSCYDIFFLVIWWYFEEVVDPVVGLVSYFALSLQ